MNPDAEQKRVHDPEKFLFEQLPYRLALLLKNPSLIKFGVFYHAVFLFLEKP